MPSSYIYLKLLIIFFFCNSVNCQEKPECPHVLNFVAQYVKLINMVPREIVPLARFCSNDTFTSYYNHSIQEYYNAVNDPTCLFHIHKLNVIGVLFDGLEEIWNKAQCQDCLDNQNDTLQFFTISDQLDTCIEQNNPPCIACASNYSMVQDYYETMNKQRRGKLCLDIEDQMNQTRHAWSAKYKCCKDKQRSKMFFIVFASIFSSIPLLFYTIMYFIARRKEAMEELARVPLLDSNDSSRLDQNNVSSSEANENDAVNETTQACSSNSLGTENKNLVLRNDKLNNLDHAHVREDELINLCDEQPTSNIKLSFGDDDDVSLLKMEGFTKK
ncbi:uncharacterized protein LOC129718800 [Wyeomyia smithii]|uniref:uncharacterized protein LOC129718800 n=1 Tax=Wyeomyia smithii TaxID=174621 RepID=UPI002467FB3C|nr:uncharacterized protein LOC129718800 [Wyeomyia smithii]